MGEYIRATTTEEAIERLCAYTSPRDCQWAWWLTMRELAAVAGLALWADAIMWGAENTTPNNVLDMYPDDYRKLYECFSDYPWEAPDA